MKITKRQLKQIIKEELELAKEREPAWWEDKEFPGGTTDADIEDMRARMREHWPEDIETLEWQDQVKLIPELVNKATGGHATIIRKFYRAHQHSFSGVYLFCRKIRVGYRKSYSDHS